MNEKDKVWEEMSKAWDKFIKKAREYCKLSTQFQCDAELLGYCIAQLPWDNDDIENVMEWVQQGGGLRRESENPKQANVRNEGGRMRRREKSVGYHFARMERSSKINKLFKVAERVIKGEYGNGLYRIKMLEMDGYDSAKVQNIVNVMLMERKK